jgi:predicted solute-binding protein
MTNERTEGEKAVRKLVATNDLRIPFSSIYQKIKAYEDTIASGIQGYVNEKSDFGNSVTAAVEYKDKMVARGMRNGIEDFKKQYPRYGAILEGLIQEKRVESEIHLSYCLNEGYKLHDNEYVSVIKDVAGLNDLEAEAIFPEIMKVSDRLKKKKKEGLREILIG